MKMKAAALQVKLSTKLFQEANNMKRRLVMFLALLLATLSLTVHSLEVVLPEPKIAVDYQPDLGSDEGGFWMKVDELEKRVKTSPLRVTDPALNQYVKGVVCKISPEYCDQIRVYIIQNPHMNASMYPNGMMHVWTGLLLRAENEAQLAAVLGHEIGHYVEAHSIERWRRIKKSTAFGTFLNFGLALAGVGEVGTLVNLAILADANSFSRDQEREADDYGLKLLARAHYDPTQASALWQRIAREKESALHKHKRTLFNATHPLTKEREKTLRREAEQLTQALRETEIYLGKEDFQNALRPHYAAIMDEQLKLHHYGRTEALLNMHTESEFDQGKIDFFKAKFHSTRSQDGDLDIALEHYLNAQKHDNAPPESYREAGYLYLKRKDSANALAQFTNYLEKKPMADDKEMINFYIHSMKE